MRIVRSGVEYDAPAVTCDVSVNITAGNLVSGFYRYAIAYVTRFGETVVGPLSPLVQIVAVGARPVATASVRVEVPPAPVGIMSQKIFRTGVGAALPLGEIGEIDRNGGVIVDTIADVDRGAEPVVVGTADSQEWMLGRTLFSQGSSYAYNEVTAAGSTQDDAPFVLGEYIFVSGASGTGVRLPAIYGGSGLRINLLNTGGVAVVLYGSEPGVLIAGAPTYPLSAGELVSLIATDAAEWSLLPSGGGGGGGAPSGPAGGDLTGTYPNPLIAPGVVTTPKIANDAVTDVKILNAAVTGPKIAAGAVSNAKISDVDGSKIADGSIANIKLVNSAVGINGTAGRISSSVSPVSLGSSTSLDLVASGVTAGTYGSGSLVPVVTVDAYGRLTAVTTAAAGALALNNGQIFVGDVANTPQMRTLSQDVTITNTGVSTVGTIQTVYVMADPVSNSISFGNGAHANVTGNVVAIGANAGAMIATSSGFRAGGVYIGNNAGQTGAVAALGPCICIGSVASITGSNGIAIGALSTSGQECVALGRSAIGNGIRAIAIGDSAQAASGGIAIGGGSFVNDANNIAIGNGTTLTAQNSILIGPNMNVTSANNVCVVGVGSSIGNARNDAVLLGSLSGNSAGLGVGQVCIGARSWVNSRCEQGSVVVGQFSFRAAQSVLYNTGTASQTGTTVTGTGTAWTNDMTGAYFKFASDVQNTILAVNSPTSLTVATTGSASGAYEIWTGAQQSTIVGGFSGRAITTGSYNTLIGHSAGLNLTTGQNNTAVGKNTSFNATSSNSVIIGADGVSTMNNEIKLGNTGSRFLNLGGVDALPGVWVPTNYYAAYAGVPVGGLYRTLNGAPSNAPTVIAVTASFVATGTTLTVTATGGVIAIGGALTGGTIGPFAPVFIVAQLTGTAGSTGTYQVQKSVTAGTTVAQVNVDSFPADGVYIRTA